MERGRVQEMERTRSGGRGEVLAWSNRGESEVSVQVASEPEPAMIEVNVYLELTL